MTSLWRHIGSLPQAPPLLVKYEFTNSQYRVFLTDLTSVWIETLQRRDIIKKALNLDTSIDPSEDSDQFRLLLRKLQDALDGQEGSHLSLSGMGYEELVLHTVTKLPPPWEPLKWPFHLACAPAYLLTTELLLPCLSRQFVANAQVESLLHILKEKEHVLNKLADKINSSGEDFADLFPGALGSRVGMKLSRGQAGKFVKGLSEFDETEWRNTLSASLVSTANLSDIVPKLFASRSRETLSIDRGDASRDWHRQLTEDSPTILSFAHMPDQSESLKSTTKQPAEKVLDKDFQKQDIPTRMKTPNPEQEEKPAVGYTGRSKPKQEPVLSDPDSTTADESDLEVKLRKPRKFTRRGAPVEAPAPAIDSRQLPNAFQTPDPNGTASLTSHSAAARPRALGQAETENGNRDMSQPKVTEAVHKPKGILGKIGGRVKHEKESELKDSPATVKEHVPEDKTSIGYVSPESRQLSQPPPAVTSRELLQPQSSPSLPPPPPTPRETSQERANNKREDLKRQLESKSNANVKKKRKF